MKTVSSEPSPQSTVTCQGSSSPGSVNEPRSNVSELPSLAVWLAGAVTSGATFCTTTVSDPVSAPPSPSVTRTLTVKVPLSAKGQLCVLLACGPTSKTLLPSQSNSYKRGSAAPAGSLAVTVTVELPPSLIGDSAETLLITGGRLATVTWIESVSVLFVGSPSSAVTSDGRARRPVRERALEVIRRRGVDLVAVGAARLRHRWRVLPRIGDGVRVGLDVALVRRRVAAQDR